jgi:putative ABC transport system permease protein
MSWIALKMLTGDKAKFFGIVLGLTFAAMLITQQGSIFCGLMKRTSGQIIDITGADLWVMDPNVRYVDDVKPMIETSLYRVRGVDGVKWAVPLYKGIGRVKITLDRVPADRAGYEKRTNMAMKPGREPVIEQVIMLGLDDVTLVGAPPPERILAGRLIDLRRPQAVIVDFTRLPKLFPYEPWGKFGHLLKPPPYFPNLVDQVGHYTGLIKGPTLEERHREEQRQFFRRFLERELEMNDHRAVIVGICEATRTFQSNAIVYTTYTRAKQFVPQERKPLTYVLAKTDDGLAPAEVAKRIKEQTGLQARTSEQFIWDTIGYFIKYTGIPFNFGITAFLGFLVGTAIAGQTFYNFTLENLKQFGALKAMGTGNLRIVGMILLQAAVTGLLGYGLGVGAAALFGATSEGGELAFFLWWPILPITAVAIVFICILSSILSVRRVVVLEPAIVFRG